MFPGGPNPTKLQSADNSPKPPLVLIHDGGGTTFGYFFLGNLGRNVWAIHDPNYWEGTKWDGGMDQMARHYISLIQNAGIRGKVILGGWSLGGLTAVNIARMLAESKTNTFSVAGLVLIDSPFHVPYCNLKVNDPSFEHLPKLIQTQFENCDQYLDTWELPSWTGPTKSGKTLTFFAGGKRHTLAPDQILHYPLEGDLRVKQIKPYEHKPEDKEGPVVAPPPGVFLRALTRSEKREGVTDECTIDLFRDEELLGWENRYPDFLKATFDLDSAHFDLFDKSNLDKIDHVSKRLKDALQILDAIITISS